MKFRFFSALGYPSQVLMKTVNVMSCRKTMIRPLPKSPASRARADNHGQSNTLLDLAS